MQHPAVEAFRGGPNLVRVVSIAARAVFYQKFHDWIEFLMQTGTPLLNLMC